MQTGSTTDNGPRPRHKRVKTSNACDECKRQKIKCDELRPACANCDRKFGSDAPSKCRHSIQPTRHAKTHNDRDGNDRSSSAAARPLLPAPVNIVKTGAASSPLQPTDHQEIPADEADAAYPASLDEDGREEASTAMLGQVNPEQNASSFFGGSSVSCFLQQIQNMVRSNYQNAGKPSEYSPLQIDIARTQVPPKTKLMNFVWPPRQLASMLLETYWSSIYPLYPFLDKRQMDSDYDSLSSRALDLDKEQSFICMLNTVFALATRLRSDVTPSDREQLASVFYDRAVSAMTLARSSSVASVQCYLLRAQYLQSTDDHHQCWLVVGLAARTAQSLGLHTAQISSNIRSNYEQQLLRRIWHGCILMDRITAMAYGRPPLVYKGISESVPLPDATPLDEIDTAKDLSFFIESLKLFRILWKTLADLYPHHSPELRFDHLFGYSFDPTADYARRSVLGLDDELSRWRQQLPDHLARLPRPSETGLVQRQAIMLHQRYLHVRIVTLRPVLSAFVMTEASNDLANEFNRDSLSFQLARQTSIVCVTLAQEAISVVSERIESDQAAHKTLSESWYNEMYIYTAGTVLIAAFLTPKLCDEVGKDQLEHSWAAAKHALYAYQAYRNKTRYLLDTLELLYESLPSRYKKLKHKQGTGFGQNVSVDNDYPIDNDASGGAILPSFPNVSLPRIQSPPDQIQHDHEFAEIGGMDVLDQTFNPNDLSWLNDLPLDLPTSFGVDI